MSFTVAIVGRPNVGKSTLFNRLVGRRLALVDDTPGVTRDRRQGEGRLGPFDLSVLDTAGLEEAFDNSLEARMRQQTERALDDADAIVMMIDARAGVTPLDRHFAHWLIRGGAKVPVILVANKMEGRAAESGLYEAYELGLGEPIALSAEHGIGLADLAEALMPLIEAKQAAGAAANGGADDDPGMNVVIDGEIGEAEEGAPTTPRTIQLAIVGRPNVGKSTLVNALIGEDRVLTGPEAGITRDAIMVAWHWGDWPIKLVDTAGMRRRARVQDKVEKLSVADGLHAVDHAQVVVLVLDADAILDKQDLTIARRVLEEGRALLIAVNKWDAVEDKQASVARLKDRLQTSLPQARGITTVTISALKRRGLNRMMDAVIDTYRLWDTRISTAKLNRWLGAMTADHPPPMVAGRRVKLRYATQIKSRPPTIALWTSRPDDMPDSYMRYLVNGLRDAFGLDGIPIRLQLRKGKNPYVKDN